VAAVAPGRALDVKWEGDDASCFLVVRLDPGCGLVGTRDEIPFDVLSPWREPVTGTWSEEDLIRFLAEVGNATTEITTVDPLRPADGAS
jgi:hypothetical protein